MEPEPEPSSSLIANPEEPEAPRHFGVRDLLLFPLRCLLQITPIHVGIILLGLAFYCYWTMTADRRLNFDTLKVSDSYEEFQNENLTWSITYESGYDSTFSGVVRYAARWGESDMLIMTHDILVATGEYADPKKVNATVSGHIFLTRSVDGHEPSGRINLLHTVPANKEVHQKLCRIREWDKVTISGREILIIKAYDRNGSETGTMQDMGCNSILVKSVTITGKVDR